MGLFIRQAGGYRAVFRDTEIFGLNAVSHWRRFTFSEGKQLDWLKRQLGKDARRRIVLCHAPLIRHNPLRNASDAPYLARDAQLQQIVDDAGKVLFLSGHTHVSLNEGRGCVEYDDVHSNLYLNDSSVTPTLDYLSKALLSFLMFLGRVGPVSLALAIGMRSGGHRNGPVMPEGKIIVG